MTWLYSLRAASLWPSIWSTYPICTLLQAQTSATGCTKQENHREADMLWVKCNIQGEQFFVLFSIKRKRNKFDFIERAVKVTDSTWHITHITDQQTCRPKNYALYELNVPSGLVSHILQSQCAELWFLPFRMEQGQM